MEQHFDGTDAAYERRQAATPIPKNTRDLLAEPRELFRTFEAKMGSPEGLIHLSEALSQLIDIAEDASSTELKQTCSTMVSTYALRVQARVQLLLTQSPAH